MSDKACEYCGSARIYYGPPQFGHSGAPNCCQTCCKMDRLERELIEARRQLTAHKEVLGMCEELILELNESGGYLVTTETEVCCSCEANGKRGQVVHDEGCMQPHVDKVLAAIAKLKEGNK